MKLNFWLGAFGLAILGAVTSQSALDVGIILLFIGWISERFKKVDVSIPVLNRTGIEWAIAGYLLTVIISYIFIASPEAEVAFNMKRFVWIPHLYLFVYCFQRLQIEEEKLLKYFTYIFLIPNIYALISFFQGYDILTQLDTNGRIIGLVSSATYHAHANAIVLVFFAACLYFGFHKLSKKLKITAIISFILFTLSVVLTLTRGIWISIFVSSLLMFSLISFRKALLVLASCVIVVGALFSLSPLVRGRFAASKNMTREHLIKINFAMWKDHPLMGVGYGENTRLMPVYYEKLKLKKDFMISHAHNQYLNVLSTTGLVGFLFFISIFTFFLHANWKLLRLERFNKKSYRYTLLFACLWAQIEFIIACVTDVSFEYAKIRALIILVWALVIALKLKPSLVRESTNQNA